VALTGIGVPIALSFILLRLTPATPIQCFAAGASLCSTSLGTTFTVLGTSGLTESRLGVVLTSAAMMDDVVGLVLVQVISNLGLTGTSITASTVLRPLLVSVAFVAVTPLICIFLAKPVTRWLVGFRLRHPGGLAQRLLSSNATAFLIHTLILLGFVSGASYAGASNLFAAYIAGASISWWDNEMKQLRETTEEPRTSPNASVIQGDSGPSSTQVQSIEPIANPRVAVANSGLQTYEQYYSVPVNRVLKPFFFV
jgi:Kef-type K+ transport system membrane component KefB